jgi:hypothetical protein
MPYRPDSGFAAGRGFFWGLDTPKHKRKKLKPLRIISTRLIVQILSNGMNPAVLRWQNS